MKLLSKTVNYILNIHFADPSQNQWTSLAPPAQVNDHEKKLTPEVESQQNLSSSVTSGGTGGAVESESASTLGEMEAPGSFDYYDMSTSKVSLKCVTSGNDKRVTMVFGLKEKKNMRV